jgi:hypothetical protein
MIQRGLTVEKLAAACGIKKITLANQIAKNFLSRRLRLIVEKFFNRPIWSGSAEFERRQHLASRCGFDVFVLTLPELRQQVSSLKIRGRSKARRKSDFIILIERHFEPKPSPQPL